MTRTPAEIVDELEGSLLVLADALATRDLDGVLAVEPRVMAGLEAASQVTHLGKEDATALVAAIARTQATLLRCQQLGDAITGLTADVLDCTAPPDYSRTGLARTPLPAGSVDTRL